MPRHLQVLTVHKFGGAALADPAAVAHAAQIIARFHPAPMVVVSSAISGTTDALLQIAATASSGEPQEARGQVAELRARHLKIAHDLVGDAARPPILEEIEASFAELDSIADALAALREITPRTQDYIVARGERLATRILAAALVEAGVPAQFVDAIDFMHTDGRHGAAFPDLKMTEPAARAVLGPLLKRGIVPVVTGFIGKGEKDEVVTLGRGGTDLTATVLSRVLKAREVILWKDVPGLLTADPRAVPDARMIPQLNVREAAELAYYGAKILHPRALIPLGERTRLHLRPFASPDSPGTEVSTRRTLNKYPVKALSAITGQALVTVAGNGMLGVPGIAARTFSALHQAGVSVSLISQASSEHSISLAIPVSGVAQARAQLRSVFARELEREEIEEVEVRTNVATVAIVGLGMAGVPGIAARLFGALAEGKVNILAIAQGSSEHNISVVVDASQVVEAQRRIHAAFQLSKLGGGAAERSDRSDVVLLGFGKIGRELATQLGSSRFLQRRVRIVGVIDRSGFVFDPRGIAPRRLTAIGDAKEAGQVLADFPGGEAATGEEAIAYLSMHALANPVLADVAAGDTEPILKAALAHGMDLVLANKVPLVNRRSGGSTIIEVAKAAGRRVRHEATVGAGLPIIDTYDKLVESGDRVLRIEGCPSGTMGYLFGELERGRLFSEALQGAMELGYTEPDPRDDLSGMDVARKGLILGRMLGYRGELDRVEVESLVPPHLQDVPLDEFLSRVTELDPVWEKRVTEAREAGNVLRYRAAVTPRSVSVGLTAVATTSSLGSLNGTDNQFVFTTMRYKSNPLVITGPGAGPAVTAAGVLNDVLKLAGGRE